MNSSEKILAILAEYGLRSPHNDLNPIFGDSFVNRWTDPDKKDFLNEAFESVALNNATGYIVITDFELFREKLGLSDYWKGLSQWFLDELEIRFDSGSEQYTLYTTMSVRRMLEMKVLETQDDVFFKNKILGGRWKEYKLTQIFDAPKANEQVVDRLIDRTLLFFNHFNKSSALQEMTVRVGEVLCAEYATRLSEKKIKRNSNKYKRSVFNGNN